MGTSKTLGNAEPTEAERQRMLAALDGLRDRLHTRLGCEFAPAVYNEADGTVELRWTSGSRAWISAWVYDGGSRSLLVWRHPSYRYEQDEAYLHEACRRLPPPAPVYARKPYCPFPASQCDGGCRVCRGEEKL